MLSPTHEYVHGAVLGATEENIGLSLVEAQLVHSSLVRHFSVKYVSCITAIQIRNHMTKV